MPSPRRGPRALARWLLCASLVGCHGVDKLSYLGEADLAYYRQQATRIDYPAVDQCTPEEVVVSDRPHTVRDRDVQEPWNMTLAEAVQLALENNQLIRTSGQFLSPGNTVLTSPNNAPSIYDPAIQETGFLFGGRGIEAALAAFDAQFTTTMRWGRSEVVPNNMFGGGGVAAGTEFVNETGNFTSQLQKQFAYGGLLGLSHNWDYAGTNSPSVLFPSAYSGLARVDYRQPLWAGSGTEFTRIAGPISQSFGGITGVSQGVTIARINNDITILDFEASVRDMVRDVEHLYWDLYLAYRQYDAEAVNRSSTLQSWREVKAKLDAGAAGGAAADEAQAREDYFATRSRMEEALANLYSVENQLRRLLSLPVNDGRLIRPVDEPLSAEFLADWHVCLTDGLTRRVELRRQKWSIKSLELQAVAARSLTNPRLDFVGSYQVNGFGDKLLSYQDADGVTTQGFHSAYETLTQGNQTAWQLGFEFTMPIGFRAAHAQLQNTELRLTKARAGLAAAEQEVAYELANALQQIDVAYATARTNFDRREAARRRVQVTETLYRAGQRDATLDLVLRAQAARAQAEVAYYTSLVRYNQALVDLHYRKGTLLENNGVTLAEGGWTPAAYRDAYRRAWARSHAIETRRQHAEPAEFVSPYPYPKTDLPWAGGLEGPIPGLEGPLPESGPLPPSPAPKADSLPPDARGTDTPAPPRLPYDEPVPSSPPDASAAPLPESTTAPLPVPPGA